MNIPFTSLKQAGAGRKIVTCDIETWGLDARPSAFALGVIYDGEKFERYTDCEAMKTALFQKRFRGSAIYAHNGGKYDYLALFGNYWKTFGPRNVVMNDSHLIQLRFAKDKHSIVYRDSLNYLPTTLAKLAAKFGDGLGKGETPEKFKKANRSQGINEQDFKYCETDCVVLHRALTHIQNTVGALRATLPSTAMATFRREFFPNAQGVMWVERALDERFRTAYYGGRVESYFLGDVKTPHYIWDINSLYPYSMAGAPFPDPTRLLAAHFTITELLTALQQSEGFAQVEIRLPMARAGCLPWRHNGKLLFPVGVIKGSWCFPELRYALSHGGEILSVEDVVTGPRIPSPFIGYVNRYYAMKFKASTDWEREIAKLMLNALYGKFAEYHGEQEIYAEAYNEETQSLLATEHGEASWTPISRVRTDGYYKFPSDDGGASPHSIYSWGAYITSVARVVNATFQERITALGGHILYTDTDSFTAEATIAADVAPLVGDEMGLLKIVDCPICKQHYTVKWVGGNKYYTKQCACGDKIVQKGVRHGPESVYSNGNVSWKGVVGLKEAIRRNLPVGSPITRTRGARCSYDKRKVLEGGETRPWIVNGENLE